MTGIQKVRFRPDSGDLEGLSQMDVGHISIALKHYEEDMAEKESQLAEAVEVLRFYADEENWDMNNMCPTIWDNGDIDLGKKSREFLEKYGVGVEAQNNAK